MATGCGSCSACWGRCGLGRRRGRVALKGPRHRAVLARLLIARGRVVPVTRLVETCGTDPPPGAVGAVRTFVAALRRALEPERPPRASRPGCWSPRARGTRCAPRRTRWTPGGSRRPSAAGRCGAGRPRRLGASWTGAAAGGAGPRTPSSPTRPGPGASDPGWTSCGCRPSSGGRRPRWPWAGRPRRCRSWTAHVAEHRWREDAWRLLALALYRAGRQGDALAVLRRARTLLVEQLGVDPGPSCAGWRPTSWPRPRTSPRPLDDGATPPALARARSTRSGARQRPFVGAGRRAGAAAAAPPRPRPAPAAHARAALRRPGAGKTAMAETLTERLAAEAGPRHGDAARSTRARRRPGRGPRSPTRSPDRPWPCRRPDGSGDGRPPDAVSPTPCGGVTGLGGRRPRAGAAGPRRPAPRRRRHPGPARPPCSPARSRPPGRCLILGTYRATEISPGADRRPGPRRRAGADPGVSRRPARGGDRRVGPSRRRRRGTGPGHRPVDPSTAAAAIRSSSANWPSCTRAEGEAALAAVPPGCAT